MYGVADALWHPPMSFVLEGVIAGLLTSLLAVGIVIVYRANRIVNFAQAELGAVPANFALLLIVARHWNYFLATATGLAARSSSACWSSSSSSGASSARRASSPRSRPSASPRSCSASRCSCPRWIGKTEDFKLPNELSWSFHVGVTNFSGNEILVLIVVPIVLARPRRLLPFLRGRNRVRATAESADRGLAARYPACAACRACCGRSSACSVYVTLFLRNGVIGASVTQALDPSVLLRRARCGGHRAHGAPPDDASAPRSVSASSPRRCSTAGTTTRRARRASRLIIAVA